MDLAGDGTNPISVATAAIRREAGVWHAGSDSLGRIVTTVDGMRISWLEAGLLLPLLRRYTELIDVVSGRCREGVESTAEVSTALRSIAEIYDDEERRNLHSLRNLY